jgi:hypothetical protein
MRFRLVVYRRLGATSVNFHRTTRHRIPEDNILHRAVITKSHILASLFFESIKYFDRSGQENEYLTTLRAGHSVAYWLRHYATSRKVAGSISDVNGFFNWPNSSSRTVALGSIQLLTKMSTRNLPGGKGRPTRGTNNLTAICERIVQKIWESRRLTTLWASAVCYRDSFTFTTPRDVAIKSMHHKTGSSML